MIPQKRDIFCIIVHYGALQQTHDLVASLLKGKVAPNGVIVVNHGPAGDEAVYPDPRVQIVAPEHNEGYAAGINIGLGVLLGRSVAPESIVICMNNDIEISDGTMHQVQQWWSEHPEPAMAGSKAGTVNLFTGRASITSYELRVTSPWSLSYIHGSFLAAPLSVFLKVHFPDKYFLYWEDVFFSRSLARVGIPLQVMPGVTVNHSEEKPLRDDRLYYLVRNGALFLEQQTPLLWRMYWRVLNNLRRAYHSWFTHEPKRSIVVRALRDARKNVTGRYYGE